LANAKRPAQRVERIWNLDLNAGFELELAQQPPQHCQSAGAVRYYVDELMN
jgi:hypothetical protein